MAGCSSSGAPIIRPSATGSRPISPCSASCRRAWRPSLGTGSPPPPPRRRRARRSPGIIDLGEGTALRVESEALAAIREELADAFAGLLMPQDHDALPPARHHPEQGRAARRESAPAAAPRRPSSRARWRSALWRHGAIWTAPGSRSRCTPSVARRDPAHPSFQRKLESPSSKRKEIQLSLDDDSLAKRGQSTWPTPSQL